jgi:hypothetical protein
MQRIDRIGSQRERLTARRVIVVPRAHTELETHGFAEVPTDGQPDEAGIVRVAIVVEAHNACLRNEVGVADMLIGYGRGQTGCGRRNRNRDRGLQWV